MSRVERWARLREGMRRLDVEQLVLTPSAALRYLTEHDFMSHERLFLVALRCEGESVAVVPALEADNFRHAVPEISRVVLWDDADGPSAAVREAFADWSSSRVAVDPLACRVMEADWLREALPGAELIDGGDLLAELMLRKDAAELESVSRAVAVAEQALEQTVSTLQVGDSEAEIAGRLAAALLAGGGETISFGPIVLTGAKSALPHGIPDATPTRAGDLLLIDFGTSVNGYHCDITRTFCVGREPESRVREVYEAVRDANRAGRLATRPGVTAGEVHARSEAPLLEERFNRFVRHRTGHGLGLQIHEPPSIMRGATDELVEGMLFTIEPGLYLDGWGGVRIEDDVVVTADGCRSLTSFGRELRVVGVAG